MPDQPAPPGPASALRLPRWQRRLVYLLVAWLLISGVLWLITRYLLGQDEAAEGPLARWALVLHGVGAYGLLLVAGSLWPLHLRLAWRLRRNRATGGAMVAVFTVLALSGLWLYYGGIGGREAASLLHWALGLALVPALLLHIATGRRAGRNTKSK